ncbi:BTB/POZ and MATH domain-containing protein 1-like [Carex rostrata]
MEDLKPEQFVSSPVFHALELKRDGPTSAFSKQVLKRDERGLFLCGASRETISQSPIVPYIGDKLNIPLPLWVISIYFNINSTNFTSFQIVFQLMKNSASVNYIRASVSHHFKFNYSEMKDLKHEQFVSSPVFHALGNEWVIDCYPRVSGTDFSSNIAFLVRLHGENDTVNPKISLSIMKKDGKPYPLSYQYLRGDGTDLLQQKVKESAFQQHVFAYGEHSTYLLRKEYVKDGSFELICSMGNTDIHHNWCSLGLLKSFSLHSQIGELLKSTEKADVTFQVENRSFMCHRLILAARSPVLNAVFFPNMAEVTQKHIKIEDMSPEVFEALLHFIYTDSIPVCDSEKSSAILAQHLFVAADRYSIEGLKSLCEDKLCGHISLDSVMTILALAQQHNSLRLKNTCIEFLAEPENVTGLFLRDEYEDLVRSFPSIEAEIRGKVDTVLSFSKVKKRKT